MKYFAPGRVYNLWLEAAGNGSGTFCKHFFALLYPADERVRR